LNLLDPDIQKYVFKWEHKNTHSNSKFIPEVQNEKQEKIGTVQVRGGLILNTFCLCDIKDSTLLHVRKYFGFTGDSYEVMDYDDNLIGIVKGKLWSSRHILTMKNSKGDEILQFNEGYYFTYGGVALKINSMDGKNVAGYYITQKEVKKGRLRNSNYHNTSVLHIYDPNFDRKSILGMFICCVLRFYNKLAPHGGEGGGGG